MLAFRLMDRGRAHVQTSCASTSLERADLLLQFLDIQDGLLKDLQLELFFLLLLALTGLLRVPEPKLVVLVVLVKTLIAGDGQLLPDIGRYEIPEGGEGVVDFGAPGLLDARMVFAAHRFARGT
jgi:hypothetical protein